jgi:excisionase family DNA binding protein
MQIVSFSVRVVAEQCGLSERTIHALMKRGALKVIRVGWRVLVPPKALNDYLNGMTRKSNAGAR